MNFFESIKNAYNKIKLPAEKIIMPIILVIYSFVGINQGVDFTDTMYSIINYLCTGTEYIDQTWAIATFLSNYIGKFISEIPYGNTLMGMNAYCTLPIVFMALSVYFCDWHHNMIPKPLLFLGEIISISLCWAPRVSLYHYLSYVVMSVFLILIIKRKYLIAGLVCGLSVAVRFPNIINIGFVALVFIYELVLKYSNEKNHYKAFKTPKKRVYGIDKRGYALFDKWNTPGQIIISCIKFILGYILVLLFNVMSVESVYGHGAYMRMINSLFAMTDNANDYTANGMLTLIINAYRDTMIKAFPLVAVIIIYFVLSYLNNKYQSGDKRDIANTVSTPIFILCLVITIMNLFSNGVITTSYYYYDSMFEPAMYFIISSIILSIYIIVRGIKDFINEKKLYDSFNIVLSFGILMIILITPIGSNNYTYPIINNMFIVAPVSLYFVYYIFYKLPMANNATGDNELKYKKYTCAPLKYAVIILTLLLFFQSALFHFNHSFVDGTTGEKRDVCVDDIPVLSGMYTTKSNYERWMPIYEFINKNYYAGKSTITFGNIPGAIYMLGLNSAISTSWPDLDSFSINKLLFDLENVRAKNLRPMIFISKGEYNGSKQEKLDVLYNFIKEYNYEIIYDDEYVEIYYEK